MDIKSLKKIVIMVALLPCITKANNFYVEMGLGNATSTELKSELFEYGIGYKFNSDWAIELKAGTGFRESNFFGVDSQLGLAARYNFNVSNDLDFYVLAGIQSITISTSDGIADLIQEEETNTGAMFGSGITYKLSDKFKLNAGYHYNDGGGWSSKVSGYSLGLSYGL